MAHTLALSGIYDLYTVIDLSWVTKHVQSLLGSHRVIENIYIFVALIVWGDLYLKYLGLMRDYCIN